MQPGPKKLVRFVHSWIINTLAVALAVLILRGHIKYEAGMDLVMASLLLGILNAFVRPIMMLIALPLLIFTLGLFTFVINALLLSLVSFCMKPHFEVDSFGYAFLGAMIIGVVSIALNVLTGNTSARIKVQKRPPGANPPGSNPPGSNPPGNGPVIDV